MKTEESKFLFEKKRFCLTCSLSACNMKVTKQPNQTSAHEMMLADIKMLPPQMTKKHRALSDGAVTFEQSHQA